MDNRLIIFHFESYSDQQSLLLMRQLSETVESLSDVLSGILSDVYSQKAIDLYLVDVDHGSIILKFKAILKALGDAAEKDPLAAAGLIGQGVEKLALAGIFLVGLLIGQGMAKPVDPATADDPSIREAIALSESHRLSEETKMESMHFCRQLAELHHGVTILSLPEAPSIEFSREHLEKLLAFPAPKFPFPSGTLVSGKVNPVTAVEIKDRFFDNRSWWAAEGSITLDDGDKYPVIIRVLSNMTKSQLIEYIKSAGYFRVLDGSEHMNSMLSDDFAHASAILEPTPAPSYMASDYPGRSPN